MSRVTLTAHLRQRMRERDILEWQVHKAVHDPVTVTKTLEGSVCHRVVIDGRVLKVWLVDNGRTDHYVVKSAAWQGED